MEHGFVFDINDNDVLWILKYCLNLMSDTSRFAEKIHQLLDDGETGGQVEWGIHRWNEFASIEYEIDEFDGYRAFMGPEEHGEGHSEYIDVYFDIKTLKDLLCQVCDWYITQYPEQKNDILSIRDKYSF
ncbi:hypothetical protein VQ7734_03838 [Vibrio quintilis]|uniref:CDI immunity protein domain-containing protein n=2 Tax=Vibrio quintilis TaxID=1117707 RepID=A0A1M7YZI0_9VIBR|nr:hypothetical protein [Vibrio quintilis]SHO58068.1 hypothetical protein VQ7734_03838 [Vibrio quintilis]